MPVTVLCPSWDALRRITVDRTPGPAAFRLHSTATAVRDRVRAAIMNAGFTIPSGSLDVSFEPCGGSSDGADLALALAILLADRAHEPLCGVDLIAWGALGLDGHLHPVEMPLVRDLPTDPWIGRFWDLPSGELPDPIPLTIVDVEDLGQAWDAMVGLHNIAQMLRVSPLPDRPTQRRPANRRPAGRRR